jgi:outer membrane protein assembly factor BamE (lipoprotein component of BamABCDE complex)
MKQPATLIWSLIALAIAGCGHQSEKESHRQVLEWDAALSVRLGKANHADILQLMGDPTARELIGEAEVWLYQFGSDDRPIKPELKVVAPKHDELILSFDREGRLQRYTVVIEGRSTKRERNR